MQLLMQLRFSPDHVQANKSLACTGKNVLFLELQPDGQNTKHNRTAAVLCKQCETAWHCNVLYSTASFDFKTLQSLA